MRPAKEVSLPSALQPHPAGCFCPFLSLFLPLYLFLFPPPFSLPLSFAELLLKLQTPGSSFSQSLLAGGQRLQGALI